MARVSNPLRMQARPQLLAGLHPLIERAHGNGDGSVDLVLRQNGVEPLLIEKLALGDARFEQQIASDPEREFAIEEYAVASGGVLLRLDRRDRSRLDGFGLRFGYWFVGSFAVLAHGRSMLLRKDADWQW